MQKSKFLENTIQISSLLVLIIGVGTAFGEQHNYTNTLPNYLEIEQGDVIFLTAVTRDGKSLDVFGRIIILT